jgi:DNA replication protein DnaD
MDNQTSKSGWIAVYRSIREHWIWTDPERLKWWLDILLEVNHKPKQALLNNSLYTVKRGQSIKSMVTWAERWGISRNRVRSFFQMLEKANMITFQSDSRTTILTVKNYDTYQGERTSTESSHHHPINNRGTSAKHQNNTNNNINNRNNEEKYKNSSYEIYDNKL